MYDVLAITWSRVREQQGMDGRLPIVDVTRRIDARCRRCKGRRDPPSASVDAGWAEQPASAMLSTATAAAASLTRRPVIRDMADSPEAGFEMRGAGCDKATAVPVWLTILRLDRALRTRCYQR